MCHTPHNPECDVCIRAHQRAPQHRAETVLPVAEPFGCKIQCDSVSPGLSSSVAGLSGERTALIVQDSSGAICAYPSQHRETADIERALCHFLGAKVSASSELYSDYAPEFAAACNNIGIVHQQSIPNVPQTHGRIERRYQSMLAIARSSLLQAGLPATFWSHALEHACTSYSLLNGSLLSLQPETAKPVPLIPFGSEVSVKTNKTDKYDAPGQRALFLGWKLQPGLRWRGEMKYALLSDFLEGRVPAICFTEAIKPLPCRSVVFSSS